MTAVKNEYNVTKKQMKKIVTKIVQDPEVSSSSINDKPNKPHYEDISYLDNLQPFSQNYRSKLGARLKMDEKWFSTQFDETDMNAIYPMGILGKFESYAEELLKREVELYENQKYKNKPSEASWLQNVSVGGTVGDRIAALVVQIHENPIVNLSKIKALIAKVDKSNRRESILTAEAYRDMCAQSLMPDRKLVAFQKRPLMKLREISSGNKLMMDKRLILWLFEDTLKNAYEEFTKQLETIAHDTVDANRIKAVGILVDLLINKPEQEQFLLSSVINKLGDPSTKVATKVVHFLQNLIDAHPNMKIIVTKEVKNLIYRLHISPRAQYYGLVFLSQIRLKRVVDVELAATLITIYFTLFKMIVEKGAIENKILALLLRGTNKAFPVAKAHGNIVLKDIDTLYKVVAIGSFNTSLQAMLLLLQVLEASDGVNDRFYCSMYRKLVVASLESSGHNHPLFFHVFFKALKGDNVDGRVFAFLKRLMQISLHAEPQFACAVLMLVSEVIKERSSLLKLTKKAQNVIKNDDDEEHFEDVHSAESEDEEKSDQDEQKQEISKQKSSWLHKENISGKLRNKFDYDPSHRNPMFANAQCTLLYELDLLSHHYHPSVALFAKQIIQNQPIEYSGDPLQDFTLMRFLDRFAYRNPKKSVTSNNDDKNEGENVDIEKAPPKKLPKRTSYRPWGVKQMAVTSEEYAKTPVEAVPIDEQFLHRYITSFGSGHKGDATNDETCSVNSDEFEAVMMSQKKKRKMK